jgi:uncharacterized protein
MKETKIGTVTELFHYLVKGMKGNSIPETVMGWSGFANDRKFAFVDEKIKSGFPWVTGRIKPMMIQYQPEIISNAKDIGVSEIMIKTPSGNLFPLASEQILADVSNLFGHPVQLFSQSRGCFDAMPISLVSNATLNKLSNDVGEKLSPKRFRPNIVVDIDNNIPFGEEDWIGNAVRIGDGEHAPVIRFDRKNIRCVMINIDPDSSTKNPNVLKEVVQNREKATGIYGTPVVLGKISVGDPIYLVNSAGS